METFNILTPEALTLYAKIESMAAAIDSQLVKSKTVKSGKFSYDYLPLDDLEVILRPHLKELNLMLDYPQCDGHQGARIIDLDTGVYKVSYCPVESSTDIQATGKQLTYLARYALLMGVLGRRATNDDDGATQANRSKSKPKSSRSSSSSKSSTRQPLI